MDLSLQSRQALVCGSSRGIGRAAAIELAHLGASVTLLARDAAALQAVADELPADAGQQHNIATADFSDPAAVHQTVAKLVGQPAEPTSSAKPADSRTYHIVINNTGGPPAGQAIDADPAAFAQAFAAHILTSQIIAQLTVPAMKAAGYGRIINIISTSVKAPIPNLGVSNTIRGAMANWAKTLATELGPFGITVNNVLPGYTATDRLTSLLEARANQAGRSPDEIAAELKISIPARRFAQPEELAAAIAFLASPAAAYINGINLPVDGGRTPSL